MRGTGDQDRSWNLSARWIPGIPVERAELRLTATYQVVPDAFVGLEYNPLADDLGLLANWRVSVIYIYEEVSGMENGCFLRGGSILLQKVLRI